MPFTTGRPAFAATLAARLLCDMAPGRRASATACALARIPREALLPTTCRAECKIPRRSIEQGARARYAHASWQATWCTMSPLILASCVPMGTRTARTGPTTKSWPRSVRKSSVRLHGEVAEAPHQQRRYSPPCEM